MTRDQLFRPVEISKIRKGRDRRPIDPEYVTELSLSIAELGLLQPIVLTADHVLVAGAHRIAACRKLKMQKISARIVAYGDLRAELAAIDENLVRNDGTVMWRADEVARRKEIWEALHPETRHGGAPGKAGGGKRKRRNPPLSKPGPRAFVTDTAAKTRQAPRTVREDVQISVRLAPDVKKLLATTPVADRKSDLVKLARLPVDEQRRVAAELAAGAGTVRLAQNRVTAERIDAEPQPLPSGPFRVLVADPPWPYGKRAGDATQRGQRPYPEMTLEAIAAMPVGELAHDEGCVLWLWATNAHMHDAFHVLDAWGFTHKTILTWDKGRIGLGDWLRGQTEHCVMAVRGRPTVRLSSQSTILQAKPREHSRKPDEFYDLVESLCPGSACELFAREPREGWTAWGGEADKFTAA